MTANTQTTTREPNLTYTVVNLQPRKISMTGDMGQWAQTPGEEAYEMGSFWGPTICQCLGLHPRGGADVQDNCWELADFVPGLAL